MAKSCRCITNDYVLGILLKYVLYFIRYFANRAVKWQRFKQRSWKMGEINKKVQEKLKQLYIYYGKLYCGCSWNSFPLQEVITQDIMLKLFF